MKYFSKFAFLMALFLLIGSNASALTAYAEMTSEEEAALAEGLEEEEEIDLTQELPKGVSINGIDVSGMTYAEALEVLDEYLAQYAEVIFTFTVGEESISATAEEVGLCIKNDDVIERAINYGNEGNALDRYLAQESLAAGEVKDFALSLTVDTATLVAYFEENEDAVVDAPVNNTVVRENGEFVYVAGQAGTAIMKSESAIMVANYISSSWNGYDVSFELYTEVDEPKGTEEELATISDVLGSYSTDFSSSSSGRKANIARAAELIDGTVLFPGETISVDTALGARTEANGYYLAGSYENGTTVESYGGGVCQVSSTLYNAVLLAELEVVTRSPHSMVVSYVEPSMDAAIAEGLKDFRFKNNTDTPIYIQAYVSNNRLYFVIYGQEYRDSNRTISYETEILETIDPTYEYITTDTEGIGYYQKTTSAHTGYKARLWKYVYVDGVEVSADVWNNSTYAMSGGVYTIGTNGLSADQKAAVVAAAAKATETQEAEDVAALQALVNQYAAELGVVDVAIETTSTSEADSTESSEETSTTE